MTTSVLVLDAIQRSALSVTRSLGKSGLKVVCADEVAKTLAGASKYCSASATYRSPSDAVGFVEDINRIVKERNISVIYPTTEVTVYTLLEHRAELGEVILPFSDLSTIKLLSDKGALVHRCAELGLPVPRSEHYESALDFKQRAQTCQFPLVLKPTLSRVQTESGWLATSVKYAADEKELGLLLQTDLAFRDHPFMVQEYIDGYGSGVFLLYDQGKCIAHFAHKRLREKPPSGGVSVLSESIEADPQQLATAKKLLDSVGWHGVAMVEFKVSSQGVAYVIEVNPRFWGSLQLAVDAGVDFPSMLHQIAFGQHVEQNNDYVKGQQLRWLFGDLDRLYIVLKSQEYSFGDKFKSFISFLIPWSRRLRYEVNRNGDLKPFWFELKNYLK